jgi:hypothetical protein
VQSSERSQLVLICALKPDAESVDTEPAQTLKTLSAYRRGIALDRDLSTHVYRKALGKSFKNALEALDRQKARGSSAKIHGIDRSPAIPIGKRTHPSAKLGAILAHHLSVFIGKGAEIAIIALSYAKRYMDIYSEFTHFYSIL